MQLDSLIHSSNIQVFILETVQKKKKKYLFVTFKLENYSTHAIEYALSNRKIELECITLAILNLNKCL
jgi:hypothetical protein